VLGNCLPIGIVDGSPLGLQGFVSRVELLGRRTQIDVLDLFANGDIRKATNDEDKNRNEKEKQKLANVLPVPAGLLIHHLSLIWVFHYLLTFLIRSFWSDRPCFLAILSSRLRLCNSFICCCLLVLRLV